MVSRLSIYIMLLFSHLTSIIIHSTAYAYDRFSVARTILSNIKLFVAAFLAISTVLAQDADKDNNKPEGYPNILLRGSGFDTEVPINANAYDLEDGASLDPYDFENQVDAVEGCKNWGASCKMPFQTCCGDLKCEGDKGEKTCVERRSNILLHGSGFDMEVPINAG